MLRLDPSDLAASVVRGRYTRGAAGTGPVPGYRDEEGVAPLSDVETYLALRLEFQNRGWAGVPFFLRRGRRLARRVTEVVLRYPGAGRPPTVGSQTDAMR